MIKYTIPSVRKAPAAPVLPVPTTYTPASPGTANWAASAAVATTTSTFSPAISANLLPFSVIRLTAPSVPKYSGALACKSNRNFDPTILDGRKTIDLNIPKSNWALALDKPPFRAYPVTGGITFTYGGLKISKNGNVLNQNDQNIKGLYACGELVGGIFLNGYPGGSGLTSGAVFGRKAGSAAALGL